MLLKSISVSTMLRNIFQMKVRNLLTHPSGGSRIFPRGGGAPTPKLELFCKFFAENCMKMKEFGSRGGGGAFLAAPLDPSMHPEVDFFLSQTITGIIYQYEHKGTQNIKVECHVCRDTNVILCREYHLVVAR